MFCLLRSAADRHPSLLLLTVNISHTVMNVPQLESRSRLSALTCCVFSLSISRLLLLTTIYSQSCVLYCGRRSLSMGKYQFQQHPGAYFPTMYAFMCLIKYSAQWWTQTERGGGHFNVFSTTEADDEKQCRSVTHLFCICVL